MSKNTHLLSRDHSPYDPKINETIEIAREKIQGTNIVKIMKKNPFEKLVPFNIWFQYPKYKIVDIYENNQHMRFRTFSEASMTPIVCTDKPELAHLKFLNQLSLYQPFYPETFYGIWEFLRMGHLNFHCSEYASNNESTSFLHIGQEWSLGTMEAFIFYHEKNQMTYQYNQYDCILSGNEKFDILDSHHKFLLPKINYLGQAYKINFINSTDKMKCYNLISIDVCHKLDNIFKWSTEEMDLESNLFYLITSLKYLKENGALIIKFNLIGTKSWTIIFDIVYGFFKEHTFFRPSISNPFNSEIYLFLNKFKSGSRLNTLYYQFYKNLYKNRIYRGFFIHYECTKENSIYKKYETEIKNWCNNLKNVIKNFDSDDNLMELPKMFGKNRDSNTDYLTQWHLSNGLKQIADVTPEFNDDPFKGTLKTATKPDNFIIKPVLPNVLYDLVYYKKLIEKRAELNYYKRVMDTKPSQIFLERGKRYQKTLLNWEFLTSKTDIYRNIKFELKDKYKAEMATNAFIKMYEIFSSLPGLIHSGKKNIKSFHICEAPGAFIAATNHFVSSKNIKWEWYAQTLKPKNEKIDLALEDHFGLIASYPDKWLFGDDDTGDITHSSVIRSYAKNPKLKNLDFMTADAGLKCNPIDLNEQEAYLGKINMGQVICILACLSIGKSAIFKTFLPMSEPLTLSLMYMLVNVFETVQLVKPATSHSYNSEVYVVLNNYKGIDKKKLKILYLLLDDPKITSKTLLFSRIDRAFFRTYTDSVSKLIDRQIASLSRNYYYYYHFNEIGDIDQKRQEYTKKWLHNNPIDILDDKNKLLRNKKEDFLLC